MSSSMPGLGDQRTTGSATGGGVTGFLADLIAILSLRRRAFLRSAVALAAIGLVVTIIAPGVLASTAPVGAAVGLAAVLLGIAMAVAVDSTDTIVRGPRHIRSIGGDVIAVLQPPPGETAADELAGRALSRIAGTGMRRIAVAPDSRRLEEARRWTDALARAIARRGRRVFHIDVAGGGEEEAGVTEVARDEIRLTDAVTYDSELLLARIGPGREPLVALESLPSLLTGLPSDIDVVVIALPALAERGALAAAETADEMLLLAAAGRSRRVDVLASLDALDATGVPAEVALVRSGPRRGGGSPAAAGAAADRGEDGPSPVQPGPVTDDAASSPFAPPREEPGPSVPTRGEPSGGTPPSDAPPRDRHPPSDATPRDAALRDEPPRDAPARDEPVRDAPARDEPVRDEPVRDEPPRDRGGSAHEEPEPVDPPGTRSPFRRAEDISSAAALSFLEDEVRARDEGEDDADENG